MTWIWTVQNGDELKRIVEALINQKMVNACRFSYKILEPLKVYSYLLKIFHFLNSHGESTLNSAAWAPVVMGVSSCDFIILTSFSYISSNIIYRNHRQHNDEIKSMVFEARISHTNVFSIEARMLFREMLFQVFRNLKNNI